jgi:antirestriction protein
MIKLYIANLGKYNEGQLIGKWVELPITEEELNEVFAEIKLGYFDNNGNYHHGYLENGSFYEEFAIHDYECNIEGAVISEWADIWELNELAEMLERADEYDKQIIESCLEVYGGEISDYVDTINEYTLLEGVNTNYDLGYYYIEEAGIYDLDSLGNLRYYIDYEQFGRDIAYDFDGGFSRHGFIHR